MKSVQSDIRFNGRWQTGNKLNANVAIRFRLDTERDISILLWTVIYNAVSRQIGLEIDEWLIDDRSMRPL